MNTIDEIDLHLAKAQELATLKEVIDHIYIARKILGDISLDKVLVKFKDSCFYAIKEAGLKLDKKRCPNCNSELSKL